MFTFNNSSITWLGHAGFLLEQGKRIIIDPFKIGEVEAADILLITHEHFDHCSIEDMRKVVTKNTIILCAQECISAMAKVEPKEVIPLRPNEKRVIDGITIETVPAYNLNKYRDPATKTVFHPKEDEKLGFILTLDGTRIYHAGDIDNIPELQTITCDVALLPVSGTYVMTPEEAAEAAKTLKPNVAIPMHYGSIVGNEADAQKFKNLLGNTLHVEILTK